MRRIWIAAATVALLGFGAAVVTASDGGSNGATTATGTTAETQTTTTETQTTTTEDRPRRERERGDDRVQSRAQQPAGTQGAVDISGPCDEAEHANDPRCTGAPAARGDDDGDDHGRGRGHDDDDDHGDDHGDDRDDDRDDDDDSSGPGGNSGPGGGDDD